MSGPVTLVYGDALMKHRLSDSHPLQPIRVRRTMSLIRPPALVCRWLKDQGHRVAYVDVDVHHGDGVEEIFYSDPDVLTISLHESGRYLFPGTGFPEDSGSGPGRGAAANLPFIPFTWDEPWLEAFDRVVPTLLRRFRPTV